MNLSNVAPPLETRVSAPSGGTPVQTFAVPAPAQGISVDQDISTTQFVPGIEALTVLIDTLNQQLAKAGQDLTFTLDTDSDRVVIRIIERDTRQVIRQIPSEEALALSKSLDDMRGLLLNSIA